MVKNTLKIWWYSHRKDFKSIYVHFSTFRRKTLSYNFQEYFKGIASIILCKTLTFRSGKILQSNQNLLKVCSEILFGKNFHHYRNPIDPIDITQKVVSEKTRNFKIFEKSEIHHSCK